MFSGVFVPTPQRWVSRFDHLLRMLHVQNVCEQFFAVKRNVFNFCAV
jgi:hypothetical protein